MNVYRLEELERRQLLTAGDLDPTFGVGGRVVTEVRPGMSGYMAETQAGTATPDGKIVLAGISAPGKGVNDYGPVSLAVVRYLADGALDTTFGAGGVVLTALGIPQDSLLVRMKLAVQSDGKTLLLAEDYFSTAFNVYRFNRDGSPDSTFNGDGYANIKFHGFIIHEPTDIAIDSHGRIIIAGTLFKHGNGTTFDEQQLAIARLLPDGTLDPSFAPDGRYVSAYAVTEVAGPIEAHLAIDAADRAVIGFSMGTDVRVTRLTTAGTLDTTFATNGDTAVDFSGGASHTLFDLALLKDQRILLLASNFDGGFSLARLRAGGSPDPKFRARDGLFPKVPGGQEFPANLMPLADGRFVVGGGTPAFNVYFPGRTAFLVGFNPSGAIDPAFGYGGIATVKINGHDPQFVLAPSGRIYASDTNYQTAAGDGTPEAGTQFSRFALLRFGNDALTYDPDTASLTAIAPAGAAVGTPVETGAEMLLENWPGQARTLRFTFNQASTLLPSAALHAATFIGGAANDRLTARNQTLPVTMIGNDGDDALTGSGGADRLYGGAGRDTVIGGDGPDLLSGGGGKDKIAGGSGADRIYGGAGDDQIDGGSGNDRIFGQAGDDILYGKAGADLLDGGAGDDRFFAADHEPDTLQGGGGNDVAIDFDADLDQLLDVTHA